MSERPRARLIAYPVAVLAPAVSLLLRLRVGPEVMDERALYIAFCPAVMIAAYLGGLGPGLLATILSGVAVSYYFLEPTYSIWIHTAHDAVALAFFVLVGAFISFLSESLHRSRGRIASSERRYAVTLASIGDAVIATDTQVRVTFLNPAAVALTGWPPADALGQPLAEVFRIVNEETRQPVEDPAAKVLRLGTVVGLANHTALLARDGRETPIDDCGAPIIDGRGGIAGVVLVFRDTTQRRRAEEAEVLRRANTRLELALHNSNIFVWELDLPDGVPENGGLTVINLWEQLGHERPAAPSREATASMLLHPDDRAPLAAALRGYLAGEAGEYEVECRLRHKDGSYRWMLSRGVAVRDGGGKPIRVLGSGVDITELKRAGEVLLASEARFRALVQNSSDIISLFDAEGTILYQSPSIERLLGYRPEDRMGRNVFSDPIVHPDDRDAKRAFFLTARSRPGAPFTAEFRLRHADGTWRDIEAIGQNFLHDPSVAGIVANYRDVTERKRAEETMRRQAELLRLSYDAILVCRLGGGIETWSRGAEMLFGFTEAEALGRLSHELLRTVHPVPWPEIEAKLTADGTWEGELRRRTKSGGEVIVSTRHQLVRGADGVQRVLESNRDITEQKRAEEALRASERRFRVFVDHAADAFFLQDEQARVLDVNRRACESLGYTRDELVGMTPSDFDPDLTPALFEDRVRKLIAGETFAFEARHRRKDGTAFPVEVRSQAFSEGGRQLIVSLARDMTDRKRAEEALRESERRFRTLTEALPSIVWTAEPDGALDYFNSRTIEYTGLSLEQLLGWDWRSTIHPEDLSRCLEVWTRSLATGELGEVEYRLRRADGAFRWHLVRALALRDDSGRITKWFGSAIDIDDQTRAHEALRESERRFRTLAEALPHMVWTAEPDGATDYYNARTTEFTGLTLEQLQGWGWRATIHPEDMARCLELWTRSIATGEPYEIEFRVRRADGAFRWHLVRALALRDDSGRITKWFGSCIDIDDQKRAQEALREAAEAAEAANRAKDEFLANVSHEIRTPMNAILGMTELVMDTPLTEDQRQCLKTVKSAADNLLGLMNDLLDFSKIEAGKLELDPADFSLRGAVGDTLRALAVRAHTKGLELIYDVQPEVPDALVGDAGRLRQVLLNLVGNAIKFTDAGEVVVRVEAADEGATEGEVGLRFTVRDTGIGIPRDQQERIFRSFEQEDTSTTRKYGGTGLGLTIAARLVALMRGQITVNSEPGRGSTFAFTTRFGLQPDPPEQVPVRPPASLRNLPVLVVDDNATNRYILEEWLRGWQMEPAAVGDGLAALDALWDAVSVGRPYALVLLDARMPDTDGLALAAKIRKRAELAATRIILLTSGERPGDWDRIREQRTDARLLKPVQQDELLETIYRVMSRADADAPPAARPLGRRDPAAAPVPAAAPLHILVAEDNEINAQLLERLLARRGHRVRLAHNGREALALADEGAFDLLLLDVHMPELDGFQVIRAVRERERSAGGHLPVIALTARARQEDRDRCLAAGMDDFLAKPIQAADLWAATERVTGSRPPADRPGPGLLDPRVLLAACGGDAATLEKICQVLRARLPDHLMAVQDALREQDSVRLREAAHKLCGTVAAFSTVVGAVASDLEDQAARGQLEEARPLVEQLEAIARELIRQVDGLSLETLRQQAEAAGDRERTASP